MICHPFGFDGIPMPPGSLSGDAFTSWNMQFSALVFEYTEACMLIQSCMISCLCAKRDYSHQYRPTQHRLDQRRRHCVFLKCLWSL